MNDAIPNIERSADLLIARRQTVGMKVNVTPTLAEIVADWIRQPSEDTAIQAMHELIDQIHPQAEAKAICLLARGDRSYA